VPPPDHSTAKSEECSLHHEQVFLAKAAARGDVCRWHFGDVAHREGQEHGAPEREHAGLVLLDELVASFRAAVRAEPVLTPHRQDLDVLAGARVAGARQDEHVALALVPALASLHAARSLVQSCGAQHARSVRDHRAHLFCALDERAGFQMRRLLLGRGRRWRGPG
jgi:hypothetical protein